MVAQLSVNNYVSAFVQETYMGLRHGDSFGEMIEEPISKVLYDAIAERDRFTKEDYEAEMYFNEYFDRMFERHYSEAEQRAEWSAVLSDEGERVFRDKLAGQPIDGLALAQKSPSVVLGDKPMRSVAVTFTGSKVSFRAALLQYRPISVMASAAA